MLTPVIDGETSTQLRTEVGLITQHVFGSGQTELQLLQIHGDHV